MLHTSQFGYIKLREMLVVIDTGENSAKLHRYFEELVARKYIVYLFLATLQ